MIRNHFIIEEKKERIKTLTEELQSVNPYVKDMKQIQQEVLTQKMSFSAELAKLKAEVQKKELSLKEKDMEISRLQEEVFVREKEQAQDSTDSVADEIVAPPPQLSQSAPLPSTNSEKYVAVIGELHREVLRLQQRNEELKGEMRMLKEKPRVDGSGDGSECGDVRGVVESLQRSLSVLESALKEKNKVIFEQNQMLMRLSQRSVLGGESVDVREKRELMGVGESESTTVNEKESSTLTEMKSTTNEKESTTNENDYENTINQLQERIAALIREVETGKEQIQQREEENRSLLQQTEEERAQFNEEKRSLQTAIQQLHHSTPHQTTSPSDCQDMRDATAQQHIAFQHSLAAAASSLLSNFSIVSTQLSEYRGRVARLQDELQNYTGNYRVMVRVRPLLPSDPSQEYCVRFRDDYSLAIGSKTANKEEKTFLFDRVLPPCTSQESVFAEVQPVVLSLFRGMNACVIAYGQTGSGKTFTMSGEPGREGLIPRCCALLFDELKERRERKLSIKVRNVR